MEYEPYFLFWSCQSSISTKIINGLLAIASVYKLPFKVRRLESLSESLRSTTKFKICIYFRTLNNMKWYQIEVKYGFIKTEPPAFIAREYHRSLRESTENETLRSFCFEHIQDKFQSCFILRTQCIVVIVRDFLWNPSSLMIFLPCQSVKQSLSHSSSRALTDVTLACENHATSPKVTQPLLALGYRILPSQIKPVAEVWSIF